MSIVEKYLNFQANTNSNVGRTKMFEKLGIVMEPNVSMYHNFYKEHTHEPANTKQYIFNELNSYINKKYATINIIGADINYYIESINAIVENKFCDIITQLNLNHLISMMDYASQSNSNYLSCRNNYYKMLNELILNNEFKPDGYEIKLSLEKILDEKWSKLNFSNFIEFTKTLNKLKFFGQNVDNFINMIIDKFDSVENIKKLLDWIYEKFSNSTQNNQLEDEYEFINDNCNDSSKKNSKYSFRFVIDNLKSNGYLLFEEYKKQLKTKYRKSQTIETILVDKRIINYFMYLISKKESNSVNRQVNEILLRMHDYVCDLYDSYQHNIGYQKITVKQESEKYKSVDLSTYNRANATFTIFKYSNVKASDNNISKYTLTKAIEPYFDIYKSFYKSRYPDREIEFDLFQSTLITKMIFSNRAYYIHMGLIQYIVLDKIFISPQPIGLEEISTQTQIQLEHLQETINSLLQIKIISRTGKKMQELKFSINNGFEHPNNKISISSMILKEETVEFNTKPRDFLHDRNTIMLSNLYDYIKKNRTFTQDVLMTDLKYKIPFKFDNEMIEIGLKTLLEKEHIEKINLPTPYENNNQGITHQIYKYVE